MRKQTENEQPTQHAVIVRMPVAMHRQLRKVANENERSVSGQVRYLIEQDLKAAA